MLQGRHLDVMAYMVVDLGAGEEQDLALLGQVAAHLDGGRQPLGVKMYKGIV